MRLEAKQITKTFGEKLVLDNISFEAESGKALGLLGRNGAGKTTAIRILMQVFPCDSGCVLLDGKPLSVNSVRLGYLPEERGLYPKRVILEQLIYLGELKGLRREEARASAFSLLGRLSMTEYADKKLETLSKGNQQKIQLAAALISDPDIVVLDEPFSGLDPVNAMLLKDVVNELIDNGKIVIFSSHQMNYIEEFCESIVILNNGRVVLKGNLSEIKRSYGRNRIVITLRDDVNLCDILADTPFICERDAKNGNAYNVTMPNDTLKAELLSLLSENNLDVEAFYVYEPSLNDIFVEYTAEGKGVAE